MTLRTILILLILIESEPVFSQIKVMSYNIRYNCCSTCIIDCMHQEKPILERIIDINNLIIDESPDIIGIQEIKKGDVELLFDEVSQIYDFHQYDNLYPRTILWKRRKFSLIDRGHFIVTGKIGPNQIDNTSSWVKIENKYSLNKYLIINNHFTPGNTGEAELSRINSAQIVIEKISELIDDDYLIVILGDFNAKPNSGSINKFNENGFYGVDINNQPTYSGNFEDIRTVKLDYIFTRKNLKASEVKVNQFKDKDGLFPSDHLPIQATISTSE